MSVMACQITSLAIVYSTVYSGEDKQQHQRSAWLAFVGGIHQWPVNSPHKEPVRLKMFPFRDVIMHDRKTVNELGSWPQSVKEKVYSVIYHDHRPNSRQVTGACCTEVAAPQSWAEYSSMPTTDSRYQAWLHSSHRNPIMRMAIS